MSKRTVTPEELAHPLIPYEEAVEKILSFFGPLEPREVAVRAALGLVASEPLVADTDVPGFENSAMDGYAVIAADTHADLPVVLRLVDDLPAGTAPTRTVTTGTAAKIMTGAPIPPGADAVVPWENTEAHEDAVAVLVSTAAGKHVRPRGEDVKAGTEIFGAGTRLRAVHLGVLASLGRTQVRVHPRPRIAILSTGDELVEPGGILRPGQIFESNRAHLRGVCEENGADVIAEAMIGDEPDAIAKWLSEIAPSVDLIVTTGGASVGEHDWIRLVLEREGGLHMWRAAIKPGKPVAFGRIGNTSVLGLPGNPGSAFVTAHIFLARALRVMGGLPREPRSVRARLGEAVKGTPNRTLFTRVTLDGETATPLPRQSSVVLSNLIPADGFAIVPPGGLEAGAEVTVEMI
ncbi:MAG: gephyrin-like molybdotransferase Glp [Actinomycetota bacterium]